MTTTDELADFIKIDRLEELVSYSDDIIAKFNADKQLALLAVADPIGVLHDFGYDLSRKAARNLKRRLPHLSREGRDRYLAWLKNLDPIPETVNIKLVKRPSGRELLQKSRQKQSTSQSPNPQAGKGAAGFDIVTQFSQRFCENFLKRHYGEGRLPRSMYSISGKLHYFRDNFDYENNRQYLGDAEHQIHLYWPSLDFLVNKSDRVRVSSDFVAIGFQSEELKGSVAVEGKLLLKKDPQGHPNYIEVTFDDIKSEDVKVSIYTSGNQAVPDEIKDKLSKMMFEGYRDFRKLFRPNEPHEPHTPITFKIIDSSVLAARKIVSQPVEVKFAISKPAGQGIPLLLVGINRPVHKESGDLSVVPNHVKPGGDFALVQDSVWLEQLFNKVFAQSLPQRFDPDSGKPSKNGNIRIDSIVWHYRKDGLTGNVSGTYEDALLWIWDHEIDGQVHLDVKFDNSTVPSLRQEIVNDLEGLDWWEKLLNYLIFFVIIVVIGILLGGLIGGLIGYAAGGSEGIIAGGIMGFYVGGLAGISFYLYGIIGPAMFDSSGIPLEASKSRQSLNQPIKITYKQDLPETWEDVTVVPNDYKINELGTYLSAKILFPDPYESESLVRINGSHSAQIKFPSSEQQNQNSKNSAELSVTSFNAGSISLNYWVDRAQGFQGNLEYKWSYNGAVIGTSSLVNVEIPLSYSEVREFEYNKRNVLGILSLTIRDSFGRTASDTVTFSVGKVQDLRTFVPQIAKFPQVTDPPYSQIRDPRERLNTLRPTELVSHVGWIQAGTDIVPSEGRLVAYTTFNSPISENTFAVVSATSDKLEVNTSLDKVIQ